MKKRLILPLFCLISAAFFALFGCSESDFFFAMGTRVSLDYSGGKASRAYSDTVKRIDEIDSIFSVNIAESDVSRINSAKAGEAVKISAEAFTVIKKAAEFYDLTDGAYNPYIYPLVKAWGFVGKPSKERKIPDSAEIERAKALCVPENFAFDEAALTITKSNDEAALDLGGIVKGYAADEAKKTAENYGVTRAIINIGRNLQLIGGPYRIGVTDPRGSDDSVYGVVSLSDTSAATSGDYERYFMVDGKRYHHIFDAKTGYPADNGENSIYGVSVICADSAAADALSTAVFTAGWDKAEAVLDGFKSTFTDLRAIIIGAKGCKIYGDLEFIRQ